MAAVMKSLIALGGLLLLAQPPQSETWMFDRLDRLGDHATTILGNPRVIDTPIGKAIEFDGVDDALMVDVHPLAGAAQFTWEAIFRPDGGAPEQRWFHLQETGSDHRMLFEIRVVSGQWCLDSYIHSATGDKALIDRTKLHSLGEWHHVAAVYDGREFRNYVDGVQQGAFEIALAPQGPGKSAIGVRMNLVNYFKGAIKRARFTRRALATAEFLQVRP
jgi:Concanavalin A-like lectin/glucanases superfamily